ncbi:MAG: hypothetical protein BWY91_01842 [bacterium ADurb.BinA028]|nr:MAG: hypothetical protein BWY91_01842 [bacterium ADurb.BinA028]
MQEALDKALGPARGVCLEPAGQGEEVLPVDPLRREHGVAAVVEPSEEHVDGDLRMELQAEVAS